MKLSELSYREYIALEALPALVEHADAVDRAFDIADQFMRATGKHRDEIAEANVRAENFETAFNILQTMHINMGDCAAKTIALTEIWEVLGVDNQTAAMDKLDTLKVYFGGRP